MTENRSGIVNRLLGRFGINQKQAKGEQGPILENREGKIPIYCDKDHSTWVPLTAKLRARLKCGVYQTGIACPHVLTPQEIEEGEHPMGKGNTCGRQTYF